MVLSTFTVAAVTTPTVLQTGFYHYLNKKSNRGKPASHFKYNEGLNLVRKFLEYASHRPVEELQGFTAQYVPVPTWVHVEEAKISAELLEQAANHLVTQLGPDGVEMVGGSMWWRWRLKELKAEWIEMRKDLRIRRSHPEKAPRTMLYVHGGAYYFGSVDEHRYQMQRHARKLKARVFAPRYRLAPQFPFPSGLQDVLACYLYLLTIQPPSTIILAGDSAGGGMVLTIMCVLRDQGIPLPAGSILISPWVDLTHSFPSLVEDNSRDYIPAHGFLHRPSIAWPPPTEEDIDIAQEGKDTTNGDIIGTKGIESSSRSKRKLSRAEKQETTQGFGVTRVGTAGLNRSAKPSKRTSIVIAGVEVRIIDQIQMYTTNDLLNHPLVSPVMQGSLGGLPPMLIITGGGEMLRDEQIFVAHKASNPKKYPPSESYLADYPREGDSLNKWHSGTDVMLQVYDDCCHVTPTLSFTRPAKYMYRSISRFGDWLLSSTIDTKLSETMAASTINERQTTTEVGELPRTDSESIISESSSSSISEDEHLGHASFGTHIGKVISIKDTHAGVPPFTNHMIRQRIDRHGNILPLSPPSELPAMQMAAHDIGVIKPEPVRRWMEGKAKWDKKYAKAKRKVQVQRAKEIAEGGYLDFVAPGGSLDSPPPSALAGRRRVGDTTLPDRYKKPSWGLRFWSMMGAKQDKTTLDHAEQVVAKSEHSDHYSSDSDDDLQQPTEKEIQEHEATSFVSSIGEPAGRTATVEDRIPAPGPAGNTGQFLKVGSGGL